MEIAKLEDVPKLTKLYSVELSKTFSVKQEKVGGLLLRIVTGENSNAWISKNNFMIGIIQSSIYDQDVKVANCLFVKNSKSRKYKSTFEQWAKDKDSDVVMFTLQNSSKTLKNDGYKIVEVRHVKEI